MVNLQNIKNRLFNLTSTKVLIFLLLVSVTAFMVYFFDGNHLGYADAMSRLNIARKVIDNLNPGFAQFGNVWLPLPQLLMVPFIWNNYMWQTGLAGTMMSSLSFILCGYFIYQSAKVVSKSSAASFFALLIYALNINVFYLQVTAMSENLFLCTIAGSVYYFLKWVDTDNRMFLIPAALWVSAMTYTRYEGLAMMLAAIPMVFVYSIIKSRKFSTAEGNVILFSTLALLGFALWTGYLFIIFNDPLYWIHYYAKPVGSGGHSYYTQAKPYTAAIWQYFSSMSWMVGLIPTVLSFLAIPAMLYKSWQKKKYYFLPLLLPLSLFAFMVLTLKRNTPVVQPTLNWVNILAANTSLGTGFNIRYGLLLLPWAAVMTVFLFDFKKWYTKVFLLLLFSVQIVSYFHPTYTPIYRIPDTNYGKANNYGKPYTKMVNWFKANYDGGLIMLSASSHEDQMFLIGIDYKNYIHEGAGKYWKESLDEPAKFATYVVVDTGHPQDEVSKHVNRGSIDRNFEMIYQGENLTIYKNKTEPWEKVN